MEIQFAMMPLKQLLPSLFLVSAVSVLAAPAIAQAETLTTRNYRVTVTRNCAEGSVTCNNVSYTGVDLRTGASIRLRGKTVHTLCNDGVTPCRFEGYQFRNGNVQYNVSQGGTLSVYQNKKLILSERGSWRD
jgi:hypothetical protein